MRVLVIEPPEPVVSLQEAKDHLRLLTDDEDAVLEGFVAAATAHIDGPDGWLGRAIGEQTLEARFDAFEACGPVRLPYPPVIDLVSVAWMDATRTPHIGDIADLELDGAEVYPLSGTPAWEGCYVGRDALRIQYRAGYQTLPPAIRAAILLMTADLFRNRSTTVDGQRVVAVPMSTTVEALLQSFRVYA